MCMHTEVAYHYLPNTFSFALFDINKYFLLSKHIEQEKVDRRPGIEPGSLNYMPSVVLLDHQQSHFPMLFNSQLRVLHCPIYDLDNLDACTLHILPCLFSMLL